MQYNIKTTDFEMTKEVSSYLSDKLIMIEKFVDKNDKSIKCDVEIGKTTNRHQSGEIFRTEINISIGKQVLRSEAVGESMNAAIDEAKDEIIKRLSRKKSKHFTLIRKGGEKIKSALKFRWK
jgi:ribosomal subunit interface protein